MKVIHIHHCAMVVQDMDRASAFYRGVLGLNEIPIPAALLAAGVSVRWFQAGDQQIHLTAGEPVSRPSHYHLALQVDELGAARSQLEQMGIAIMDDVTIPGVQRFSILDPDGNRLEIIEQEAMVR